MKEHQLIKPSPERSLSCNLCSKKCINLSSLDEHSLSHSHYDWQIQNSSVRNAPLHLTKFSSLAKEEKSSFNEAILVAKGQLPSLKSAYEQNDFEGKCKLCPSMTFENVQKLNEHKCVSGNTYVCDICKEVFIDKELLERHISSISHEVEEVNWQKLIYNKGIQPSEKYVCYICLQTFNNEDLLQIHCSVYHTVEVLSDFKNKQKPKYVCDICQKAFVNNDLLQTHCTFSHSVSFSQNDPHICDICQKTFGEEFDFDHHKEYHTDRMELACTGCPIQEFRLTEYLINQNDISSENLSGNTKAELYPCDICKKEFSKRNKFCMHLLQHCIDSRSITCGICNEDFISKHFLCNHLQTCHEINSVEKPFICNVCHKGFEIHKNLMLHQHLHSHNDILKCLYICGICNKSFPVRKKLCEHVKSCHGILEEKPFICTVCHKTFKIRYLLLQHSRIHTGEKPYPCDLCFKTFKNRSNLLRHNRQTHTHEKKYACDFCEKTFFERKYLTNHRRVHTGEKPFVCDICHKACTQKYNLTVHYRTHTGEKRYTCDVCGESFTYKQTLVQHQKKHFTAELSKS